MMPSDKAKPHSNDDDAPKVVILLLFDERTDSLPGEMEPVSRAEALFRAVSLALALKKWQDDNPPSQSGREAEAE